MEDVRSDVEHDIAIIRSVFYFSSICNMLSRCCFHRDGNRRTRILHFVNRTHHAFLTARMSIQIAGTRPMARFHVGTFSKRHGYHSGWWVGAMGRPARSKRLCFWLRVGALQLKCEFSKRLIYSVPKP